jgi:hypothetical protein
VLAAAAHLVTPNQRQRLGFWYPNISIPSKGPYLDLYVMLHEMPHAGLRTKLCDAAQEFGKALLSQDEVSTLIRAIHVLETTDPAPPGQAIGTAANLGPSVG